MAMEQMDEEEELEWAATDRGKNTSLIVLPGRGEAGHKAVIKRAAEVAKVFSYGKTLQRLARVAGYDSKARAPRSRPRIAL